MLRRAENVTIYFKPGFLTGQGWVTVVVSGKVYRTAKISKARYEEIWHQQQTFPCFVISIKERNYWQFQGRFYWDNDDLNAAQIHALLVTKQQREEGRINRAQAMMAMGGVPQPQQARRDIIPEDVKQFVWMRDGGRCRNCGSQTELQFDHVIPVSMGGGSAHENLQVLCGPCNRRKSAGIRAR